MFNLGVATSIAKNDQYSWDFTIDFCIRHDLDLIQFFWQNPIPRINLPEILDIPQRFLHLPVESNSAISFPQLSALCTDFATYYKSNRLILHQQIDCHHEVEDKWIEQLAALNFSIGLENDYSKSLTGFQSALSVFQRKRHPIFVVFDIHKFFNRFYQVHTKEQILQTIADLFLFSRELNLTMILHIIDSGSFDADRNSWCPVFAGILPYRQIFNLIKKYQVDCAGLILEYEDELMATESIKLLREFKI
jgi:hypothetical protein